MPAVSVQCPHCSRSYSIDDSLVGRRARCKHCGNPFAITPSGEIASAGSGAPASSNPPPGSRSSTTRLPEKIGRFLIKERLGAGAWGSVYRALDPALDRDVALKVPHPEFQRDPKAVERFLREGKVAAKLHHPCIVTVFEAGTADETSYIASAFIAGRSLAAAIDGGPFEPRRAARIVAALADALHAAHQQGIIHRDVKPANVLLDRDDRPHLADFGVAGLAADGARLTHVGSTLGTPAYLAPEQARGHSNKADAAGDQYSLGVTLYELLSGALPFSGPLEIVIFNTLHTSPPPLRSKHPELPAELEAICLKTLSKRPEERYASCRELANDLNQWLARRLTSLEIAATPAQSAAVVGVAGPATAPGLPVNEAQSLTEQTKEPVDGPTPGGGRGLPGNWIRRNRVVGAVAASLLFSSMLVGAWLLASRLKSDPIPTKAAIGEPAPQDRSAPATPIATTIHPRAPLAADQPAKKAAEPKKEMTTLAAKDTARSAAKPVKATAKPPEEASGSGSASSEKTKTNADPGLKLPYEERVQAAYEAALANQGDRAMVLLASCPAELRGWEWYYCQRLSRGGMTTIPGQNDVIRVFEYSPDGKLIALGGDIAVRVWDGQRHKKLGDHKSVVGLSFSGDGKRVISLGADNRVKEWEVAAASVVRSFELPFPKLTCNEISRGGRWIAAGNRSGTIKVWDTNDEKVVATRELRQSIRNLAFNADGTKIIAAVRDGVSVFDWRDAKAAAAIRNLGSPSSMAISLDGRTLAVATGNSVGTWDLSTNASTHVLAGHEGDVRSVVYSPDGKRLATGGLDRTVQVWDATTGRLERSYDGLTREVTCIRFSADNKFVAASSPDGGLRVWRIRDDYSEKDLNFQGPDAFDRCSFSDDGQTVYCQFGAGKDSYFIFDSSSLLRVAQYGKVLGRSPRLDRIAQVISGRIVIKDSRRNTHLGECTIDPSQLNIDPLRPNRPLASVMDLQTDMILIDNNAYFFNIQRTEHLGNDELTGANISMDTRHLGVWDNAKGDWRWWKKEEGRFSQSTILPGSGNVIGVQRGLSGPKMQAWSDVTILDIRTGGMLEKFPGDSFTIHPNGDLLAVFAKGTVEIWSLKMRTRIATFKGEECSFDPSGRLIASRTKGTFTIWELRTKRRVSEFQAGSAVAFSRDGRRVVVSQGNEVMVRDPLTGRVLLRLRGRSDNFAFSPDGRIIASALGSTVRFWVADPPSPGPDGP